MSHNKHPDRQTLNFAAGPAQLPYEVLERAHREFLNYDTTGCNVMELSHRSGTFSKIITKAEKEIRNLLSVPDNYKILFSQGGGNGQFSAVALNLIGLKPHKKADYIVTGYWSERAAKEAEKYGHVNYVLPPTKHFTSIPDVSEWKLDPEASYVYYCDNETIHGVEFDFIPETGDVPLVADCSSNFLSRRIDIKRFGVIFAGAQKNVGPAGVTIVIIREDLLGHQLSICPSILDYKILASNNSLFQTPPTFGIYMCGLVFDWMIEHGGIEGIERVNAAKAALLYDAIDNSDGFFYSPVEKQYRSRMNVPFRIKINGAYDEKLEKKFLLEAEKLHMRELNGHRSVGGIRASIFNAISLEEVQMLVAFMKQYADEHRGDVHKTAAAHKAQTHVHSNGHINGIANGTAH